MPSGLSFSSVIGGLEESMIQEGVISLIPINVIEIDIKKLLQESVHSLCQSEIKYSFSPILRN